MELKNIKENFVFTTRIDLNDEGDYIVLRELNMQEMRGMKFGDDDDKNTQENISYLEGIFKDCLVEHSFLDNGQPATKAAVYNELKGSGSLFLEVLTTWLCSLPFSKRLKKKNCEASAVCSSQE